MTLPWQESDDSRYLILDLNSNEIIGFFETEEQATRKAIAESFGKHRNIEVFIATGFSSWKNKLNR